MFVEWKEVSIKSNEVKNGSLEKNLKVGFRHPNCTVLLVDDDPLFCKIIKRVAEKRGIKVVACQSVESLAPLNIKDFNVVVMDYNLGNESPASGLELVKYLEMVWGGLPVIMVSQTDRNCQSIQWPNTVKTFVWKVQGAGKVLDLACEYAK